MKQLVIYFGLTYFISWLIWLPLYGYIFGLTDLPVLPFHHAIGGLGPLIGSVISTWIFSRQAGTKQLIRKCFQLKPLIYLFVALLSPGVLSFVAILMSSMVDQTPANFSQLLSSKEFSEFSIFTFFAYNLLFFGFGEEVGWRGFALPRLQQKFSAFISSIILTIFWALWHWPLFLYLPGYSSMDIASVCGWIFSLLTGSVLLAWLFNSSGGSILICAIFHSSVDVVFTSEAIHDRAIGYLGFLITVWGILTVIVFKPKNLARVKAIRIYETPRVGD